MGLAQPTGRSDDDSTKDQDQSCSDQLPDIGGRNKREEHSANTHAQLIMNPRAQQSGISISASSAIYYSCGPDQYV